MGVSLCKMSTLGDKAQVPCETALGGTKTQAFAAWLAQGHYILNHLWINLCEQTWVFLANGHSALIHCGVCQSGALLPMEGADRSRCPSPPHRSPTAAIRYPKHRRSLPWVCCLIHREKMGHHSPHPNSWDESHQKTPVSLLWLVESHPYDILLTAWH